MTFLELVGTMPTPNQRRMVDAQLVASTASERHRRYFPVNVTGAIGAIALDMGLSWQITKAFALIGRTLGAMAHIGEEIRNPMALRIDRAIKSNLEYVLEDEPD